MIESVNLYQQHSVSSCKYYAANHAHIISQGISVNGLQFLSIYALTLDKKFHSGMNGVYYS